MSRNLSLMQSAQSVQLVLTANSLDKKLFRLLDLLGLEGSHLLAHPGVA